MEADAESLLTIRVSLLSEGNHLTLRRRVDYLSGLQWRTAVLRQVFCETAVDSQRTSQAKSSECLVNGRSKIALRILRDDFDSARFPVHET